MIRASHACGFTEVDFDYARAFREAGYGTVLGDGLTRNTFFLGRIGEDMGPRHEFDLSGVASANVVWVALRLSGGRTVGLAPRAAPAALRRSRPWLRRLRFFDRFVPRGRRPRAVTLYDARGHVIARTSHRFDVEKPSSRATASSGI
jgi:hypothetical protein